MATILTVHGTNASGPENGEDWWQKGSEFENCLHRLVEAEEGKVSFQPIIWDGANSELSRRAAGHALCGAMNNLEKRQEPYSIIGHSHGGSVISAALIKSAGKRRRLDQLKNWLTVGTPFIQTRKQRFLFLRLGAFGKAAYIALLTTGLFFLMLVVPDIPTKFKTGSMASELMENIPIFLMILVVIFIPFIIYYLVNRYIESKRLHRYQSRATNFANKTYGPRLMSFWHKNDEAVQGLMSLKAVDISIFAKTFAVNWVKLLSLLLLPILLVSLVITPRYMSAFNNAAISLGIDKPRVPASKRVIKTVTATGSEKSTKLPKKIVRVRRSAGKKMKRNTFYILNILRKATGVKIARGYLETYIPKPFGRIIANILDVFLIAAVLLAFSLGIMFVVGLLANTLSLILARLLNPVAMNQIKASAFGSDALVDAAVDARAWPMWMDRGHSALPDDLGEDMQTRADAAAAKSIPKFRNAVRLFASSAGGREKNDMLSDYLTWDELIHTSYFSSQRFCKLIAYALTQNDGFRASKAFKSDPDYELVAGWHRDLVKSKGLPA